MHSTKGLKCLLSYQKHSLRPVFHTQAARYDNISLWPETTNSHFHLSGSPTEYALLFTKMKLNTLLTSASLAAAVLALPNYESQGHLDHPAGSELIKAPIPQSMTVKEAVEKCGEAAQLSCCNKVTYAGDTTVIGGGLSNILGSGSGSTGASLATECSYIHVPLGMSANI
jgi:hypothetical protein